MWYQGYGNGETVQRQKHEINKYKFVGIKGMDGWDCTGEGNVGLGHSTTNSCCHEIKICGYGMWMGRTGHSGHSTILLTLI